MATCISALHMLFWNTLLLSSLVNSYSFVKAQLQPSPKALGRDGPTFLELAEPCIHSSWDKPPGMLLFSQGPLRNKDHGNTPLKVRPES